MPDVGEQVRELTVRGLLREFQQDLAPWTSDVLRIGKVFMDDPVKRVEQFFFEVHSARRFCTWSPIWTAMLPPAESHDPGSESMKIFVCIHFPAHAIENFSPE